jgi:tRNA threonylcarbamoyladenosine biosynthesis protein TsaB
VRGAGPGAVLAIDSSTRDAFVAVEVDGALAAEEAVTARANASSALLPAVDRALRAAGLVPGGLTAVVVGGGPGSFTGLRIAAATAKGIVHPLHVPLFAYSGLLAAAAAHRDAEGAVCALFDARNREVFAGCWRFADGVEEVLGITAAPVDEVVERLRGTPVRFVGEGAALHAELLAAAFGARAVAEEERSPAAGLLWLARAGPDSGLVADPAAWEPDYVRAAGVERIAAARGAG